MGDMGRCRDCRWWERRVVDSTTYGWCRYLTDVKGDIGVFLIIGEWEHGGIFGEKVFTPEGFGCPEFEAKP